jgi:Zn-dependent metalloprotease
MVLAVALSTVYPEAAAAGPAPAPRPQEGGGVRRGYHAQTGKLTFIGANPDEPISVPEAMVSGLSLEDRALVMASAYASDFGLSDPAQELRLTRSRQPGDGRSISRYQQVYQGVPVMGGELVVYMNADGYLLSMNGEISPDLSLPVKPRLSADQARDIALPAMAKVYLLSPDDLTATPPELWIFDERLLKESRRPAELVWRMEVSTLDGAAPVNELVLVNAEKGGISLHFNQMDTSWSMNQDADTPTRNRPPSRAGWGASIPTMPITRTP